MNILSFKAKNSNINNYRGEIYEEVIVYNCKL